MRLSILETLNHLCQCLTVDQFDAHAAREPPRLLGVASGRNEEASGCLSTSDDARELAHGLHTDSLLLPLLALNDESLAVLAQRQIDTAIRAVDGILDNAVASSPKCFAND
jgi:hypothetical protein